MMKSILMKNTVAGIILALIAMTVYGCDQKKKTCEEKNAVTCHIVEKHIPASDVLYLKAYPLSASYQTSKDTIILGYNYRSHALDVIDCRTDSVREIRFEKEGNNAVTGRLTSLYVHNMDSIWIYSESMQAYLVDQTGSIRQKLNLNDYLQDEFTEFKIAGNSGKNSVLITVSAIFQRKIGRNDNGFLPEQTFVQTGKEMGERHCRGSFGAEIVDNEQIAAVEIRTECGKLFPCPIVKRVPGE